MGGKESVVGLDDARGDTGSRVLLHLETILEPAVHGMGGAEGKTLAV